MDKTFQFKQFSVNQSRCAMKIGTDSVLLGAWTSFDNSQKTILDVGTGTGILSLMAAQQNPMSFIEAIEIDSEAYEECVENFESSPWSDRLFCYHASLLEFAQEVDETFDIIVCNPPFYSASYKTNEEARNLARFQDAMPFEHLLLAVGKLLSEEGHFSVIIPYKEKENFISLAEQSNLFPNRMLHVKGNAKTEFKRSLIEFSRVAKPIQSATLIIENGRHNYTEEYINLTKEFYLKM